jgi:hypothetical protein
MCSIEEPAKTEPLKGKNDAGEQIDLRAGQSEKASPPIVLRIEPQASVRAGTNHKNSFPKVAQQMQVGKEI